MYIFPHLSQMIQLMRDVSAHEKLSWKVYGVLDTVENSTSYLGHTLQRLSPHRTMWELSLLVLEVLDLVWGGEDAKRYAFTKESANVAFFLKQSLGKRDGSFCMRDQCFLTNAGKEV